VCEECWSSCRQVATRVSVELGDLDEEEVKKERAERNRLYSRKRNRDSPRNDFLVRFAQLIEASDTVQGLKSLRWELMVENPANWAVEAVFCRYAELPAEALQVILQAVEARKDDIPFTTEEGSVVDNSGDAMHFCSYFIAKEFRKANNYRAAVPWAELSVFYAIHSEGGESRENLAGAYLFSSQIYAVADLLSKSLEDFEKCASMIEPTARNNGQQAREMILDAMKEWTGTSGKLTPGV